MSLPCLASVVVAYRRFGQILAGDALLDASTLAVRYNFDNATRRKSINFPFGALQSSSALGPAASWSSLTNALSPHPFVPTGPALVYRLVARLERLLVEIRENAVEHILGRVFH